MRVAAASRGRVALAAPAAPAPAAPVKGRRDRRYGALLAGMMWFQILYMVLYIHEPTPGGGAGDAMAANPLYRAYKLILLALAAGVIISRMQVTRKVLGELNVFFLGFLALALLSITWSI